MIRNALDFRHWAVWTFGIGLPLVLFAFMRSDVQDGGSLVRQGILASGGQVVAVVVGAEFCASSRRPDVRSSINNILRSLSSLSRERGEQFVTVGVAVDPSPVVGARFLEHLFEFDEFITGGNWTGIGAVRFLWRDFPGPATIPQVIVIHRDMVVDTTGQLSIRIQGERVLRRLVGASDIVGLDPATLNLDLAGR